MSSQRYVPERTAPSPPNNPLNDLFPPYNPRSSSHVRSDSPSIIETQSVHESNKAEFTDHMHGVKQRKRRIRWKMPRWRDIYFFFMEVLPRGWSIEVISSIISVAAFFSIVIVLNQYNQRPNPSLPLDITLNTLLAFLTAVSQSCFIHPVVQGLSQMKWNWFVGRDRPLVDFEKFDNASRGAWGSMLLVFSTKGRLSALLAAVILATSAVTSTVTQAVLTQDTRYVPGPGNTTVLRAINDTGFNFMNVNDALAMMMNAMYTRPNATYEFDAPACSSGNCNYPSFGSLAMCAQSHDVTDKLYTMVTPQKWCYQQIGDKWDPKTWGADICSNYSYAALSSSIYLDYFSPGALANTTNLWLNSNDTWTNVLSFDHNAFAQNALAAVYTIYLDDAPTTWNTYLGGLPNTTEYLQHSHAVETLFYLCAQEFSVSTANGSTTTNVTATLDYVTDTQAFEYTTDHTHYTLEHNRTFVLNGHNYSYVLLDSIMGQLLNTFFYGKYNNESYVGMEYMSPFSYAVGNAMYHNSNIDGNTTVERNEQMQQALGAVMNNTAKGVTNWIRSVGTPVQGQADVLEVFVVVRWRFLIFLGVQIGLSVCFLLWIMIDSKVRKTRILKESALATLFTIPASDKSLLEEQLAEIIDEENDRKRRDIEQFSNVRLVKDGSGYWSLKLADQNT